MKPQLLRRLIGRLEATSRAFKVVLGAILITVIGALDFHTGYELGFSLFYLLPIGLFTWLLGRFPGTMASLASAAVWLWADLAAGHFYANAFAPYWNTLIRLSFFLLVTALLSALREAIARERELARLDFLTGAVNSRRFYELAQREIERCQRYRQALTIAYVDVDDFKRVNDHSGHTAGDGVLRAVAACLRRHLRRTDVVARLGGDEFALLLPETGPDSARAAIAKAHGALMEEMRRNGCPVTFSIGVVTCTAPPPDTDELIRIAAERMYAVKRGGKDRVVYATYTG